MCRICHDDEEKDHALDRRAVDNIVCIQCSKKQEIARNCCECGILFGKYTCTICRLFDDTEKEQFHCVGCGICRVGGRENFFHCPKCNICISTRIQESHKCVEDMSRRKCPVCLEDLHSSRKKVDIPMCSHMIHIECMNNMLNHGKTACPICYQSLVDMKPVWESIDSTIVNTEMPEIYRDYHVNVLCRDCHEESRVVFHVIGLKCSGCGGYNTTRIGGDDPLPEEPAGGGGGGGVNLENLSVNSDDENDDISNGSWETIYTEEDGVTSINVGDIDVSVRLQTFGESDEESDGMRHDIVSRMAVPATDDDIEIDNIQDGGSSSETNANNVGEET